MNRISFVIPRRTDPTVLYKEIAASLLYYLLVFFFFFSILLSLDGWYYSNCRRDSTRPGAAIIYNPFVLAIPIANPIVRFAFYGRRINVADDGHPVCKLIYWWKIDATNRARMQVSDNHAFIDVQLVLEENWIFS